MLIDKYSIDSFLKLQYEKMEKRINSLNFNQNTKDKIMSCYKDYILSYISFLNCYAASPKYQEVVINNINNTFVNKVLLIPNDSFEITIYINYINKNSYNIDPIYLKEDEKNLISLIASDDFDIIKESLVNKTETYLSLFHTIKQLAFKLGYNDKKSEYKPNKAFTDDNVPSAIKDAIKEVEK